MKAQESSSGLGTGRTFVSDVSSGIFVKARVIIINQYSRLLFSYNALGHLVVKARVIIINQDLRLLFAKTCIPLDIAFALGTQRNQKTRQTT